MERLLVDVQQPLHPGTKPGLLQEVCAAELDPPRAVVGRGAEFRHYRVRHHSGVQGAQADSRKVGPEVTVPRNVGRDHGGPAADGLEGGEPEPLVCAGSDKHIRRTEERARIGPGRHTADGALHAEAAGGRRRLLPTAHEEREHRATTLQLAHELEQQRASFEVPVPHEPDQRGEAGRDPYLTSGPRSLIRVRKGKAVDVDTVREQHGPQRRGTPCEHVLVARRAHAQVRVHSASNDRVAQLIAGKRGGASSKGPVSMPHDHNWIGFPRRPREASYEGGCEVPAGEVGVQDRRCVAFSEQRGDSDHAGAARRHRKDTRLHSRATYLRIPGALLSLRREDRFERPAARLSGCANCLERRYERSRVRSREVGQVNDADPAGSSRPHRGRVYRWSSYRKGAS